MTHQPFVERRMRNDLQDKVEALEDKVVSLEHKIDSMSHNIEDLVSAWNTAKGMTTFVKWLASLASAGGIIYAIFSHGASIK